MDFVRLRASKKDRLPARQGYIIYKTPYMPKPSTLKPPKPHGEATKRRLIKPLPGSPLNPNGPLKAAFPESPGRAAVGQEPGGEPLQSFRDVHFLRNKGMTV